MPELTPKERLQPSLLDRLTDDDPDVREESRERRAISHERLRSYVLRDLTWLFNTTNMASMVDLSGYPEVAKSVLNYGLPDLAGHTVSGMDVPEVEQLLRRAILNYEPRLIQRTVKVRVAVDLNSMSHNSVNFAIDAELFAQPLPQQLYMRTEIDFEDGEVKVALRDQREAGQSDRPGRG